VSLEIYQNEYVAVMGHSGSGKSTLMNLLGCLDRATSGVYELDKQDTTRMGNSDLARVRNEKIGFVFQSFELLPRFSALKNVELPLIYSRQAVWNRKELAHKALERVGLGERTSHRPNQLSGGEKQRVAVARHLINNPAILLADEPTGNLDSKTARKYGAVRRCMKRDRRLLGYTRGGCGLHAKRIIRMRDGKVISDLPTEEDAVWAHRPAGAGR
jgi:putative ABC transport system ATP-binding protein